MHYIAFLGGINVGGHVVKMDRLRALFVEAGCTAVRTYIQSGNVFFDCDSAAEAALTATLEEHLRASLGYSVPVFLRTVSELDQLLAHDPFQSLEVTSEMRCCVVFAAGAMPQDLALPLSSPKGDLQILKTTEREAFVVWHLMNGKPPASQPFLTKTLGSRTTSRFFHTAHKILHAAKQR